MQIIGEQSEEEGVGGEKAMRLSCSLVKCEAQTKAQIKQRTRRKTLNEQAEKGQLRITQDSEFPTGSLTFCMQRGPRNSITIGPALRQFMKLEILTITDCNLPAIGAESFWGLKYLRILGE